MHRSSWLVVLLGLVAPMLAGAAQPHNYFVITAAAPTQAKAQELAALAGGWALDTDLYEGLKPGLFVVVRGPFAQKKDADKELAFLKEGGQYKDAYVKDAGSSRLPANIGEAVGAGALAAILGEIEAGVTDHPGGGNPCEPQEPYQEIRLSYVGLQRTDVDAYAAKREEIDLGGFWIIKRTGAIQRMRICTE